MIRANLAITLSALLLVGIASVACANGDEPTIAYDETTSDTDPGDSGATPAPTSTGDNNSGDSDSGSSASTPTDSGGGSQGTDSGSSGSSKDSGSSSSTSCSGYDPPTMSSTCTSCSSKSSTCQSNGCYNGYYCEYKQKTCVSPSSLPSGC